MARLPVPRPQGPFCTPPSLTDDFRKLGINKGDTILVHSSLSSMGWVAGGAESVVTALLDVLGDDGTLVVPAFSCGNSDPSTWKCPPVALDVDEAWWQPIRDTMPPYNPQTTRTLAVGVIAETVRSWPGAIRSAHPQTSFAAVGPKAALITSDHALDCCLGERSPLAVLEKLHSRVLLLGVGFHRCTSFHLAEGRISSPTTQNSFAVSVNGTREWMTVEDTVINGDDFEDLGKDFERSHVVVRGLVGAADCALFSLPEAVDYAQQWFQKHRIEA